MPLITCPECSHQVSTEAPNCPQCGTPIKRRVPFYENRLVLVLAILFCAPLAIIFFWIGNHSVTTKIVATLALGLYILMVIASFD